MPPDLTLVEFEPNAPNHTLPQSVSASELMTYRPPTSPRKWASPAPPAIAYASERSSRNCWRREERCVSPFHSPKFGAARQHLAERQHD
jgi:hypothetical protein